MTTEPNNRTQPTEPEEDRSLRAELAFLEDALAEPSPEQVAAFLQGKDRDLIEAGRRRLGRVARSGGRRLALGALARQSDQGDGYESLLRGERREVQLMGLILGGGARVDLKLELREDEAVKIAVIGGLEQGEIYLCLGEDDRSRTLAAGDFRPGATIARGELESGPSGLPLIELYYQADADRSRAPLSASPMMTGKLAASELELPELLLSADGKTRFEFDAAARGRCRVSRLENRQWIGLEAARIQVRTEGRAFTIDLDLDSRAVLTEDQLSALATSENNGHPIEVEIV